MGETRFLGHAAWDVCSGQDLNELPKRFAFSAVRFPDPGLPGHPISCVSRSVQRFVLTGPAVLWAAAPRAETGACGALGLE